MQTVLARPGLGLLRPSLGLLLVAGGLSALGWTAYSAVRPGPAPYHYQRIEQSGADLPDKLGLDVRAGIDIGKYEVRVEGMDSPIAVTHVARKGDAAPVMLDWENRGSEPVAFADVDLTELIALTRAIDKHASQDAVVLGWWDTSRQIGLLSGRKTLFTSHLAEPFIAPKPWRDRSGAIRKYEREFWGAPAGADEELRFRRFVEALADDVAAGPTILRELAGRREAYVVVHVSDLYKLGLMRPDRLGIAYRDFPISGDLHGPIGFVKHWMLDHDYIGYALDQVSQRHMRAYFLSDAKSANTLLAQMLPLTTSRPFDLQALELVYQHGGYWVYRIPPA